MSEIKSADHVSDGTSLEQRLRELADAYESSGFNYPPEQIQVLRESADALASRLTTLDEKMIRERWRAITFPQHDKATFDRYFDDLTASGWDEVRQDFAGVLALIREVAIGLTPEEAERRLTDEALIEARSKAVQVFVMGEGDKVCGVSTMRQYLLAALFPHDGSRT